jgi:ribosome-associated toxin RatA of RatAB toxin-antitoxin module
MISGERSEELDAGPEEVWAVIGDVAAYPEWMSLVREAEIRETDGNGRPLLVESVNDAKVKTVRVLLRYAYDEGRAVSWHSESGAVRALDGILEISGAGEGRSRVTYRLSVDPGRRLGLLLRGPIVDQVRERILGGTLSDLRARVEAAGP